VKVSGTPRPTDVHPPQIQTTTSQLDQGEILFIGQRRALAGVGQLALKKGRLIR
jgi:hypothetical protein